MAFMLSLRPATLKDAGRMFAWRNDPETRKQSQTEYELSMENHLEWLATSLAMPGRKLYIAEHEGAAVGTVRSDTGEDGTVELSWTVAPEERRKGFGKMMVMQFVKEMHPGAKFLASIRKGNIASEKIAQALGLHAAVPKFPDKEPIEHPLMLWR
jgi:RimJ/RimL family protein N-acetyltransferase